MVGFGVSPDLQVSLRFLEKATELEHPMALLFGSSLKQALVGNNTADAPLSPPGIVRESYTQNLILGFRADKFDVKGIELNDDDGALLVGPEKFQSYAALKVFLQSLNETQREKTIKLYVTTMPFSIRMDLLSLAISMDDVDTVRWLAKIYIRRKKITLHDETTLIQACRRGSVEMVMSLLDAGADPLKATEEGCSLYHWLFMLGDGVPIVVDKLLALQSTLKNKLLDQPCSRTYSLHQQWPLRLTGTPLAFAIECNSITAVKALLRLGASPYAPAYSNSERRSVIQWTPIHLAFKFHQADIIKLLLNEDSPFLSMAHEVAVNIVELAQSICYSTLIERIAIHGAARQMTALSETIRMLHPEVLSTPTKDGQTPLMQAIDFSNIDVVNAMIMAEPTLSEKRFVDPDDQKIFTYPAIFAAQVAAKRDSTNAFDIVKLLLQHIPYGTKLRDSQGRTPLHFSVTGSSTLTTKWLVMNGYDLDDFDSDMRTPIHNCRTAASLKILLDLGQDINQADRFGNTPLHNAALQGLEDMVEGLIFRNANLTVVGNIGSALHCAVLSQSRRVVSLLLKAGNGMDNKIDIHAVDSNGDTALHLAARILRPDLLQLLFSNRINRKIRNKAGLTAKSQLKAKRPYGFGKVKPHKLDTQNEVLEQERRVHGETKLVDDTSVSTCNTEGEGEGETETNIEDKPPGAGVVEISETEIRNDNGDSTKDMLPPLLPTEPIPKVDVETTSEFENENIGRSSSSSSSSSSSAEQPPHEASPQRPRTMLEEEVASALLQSFQNAEAQYLNDMLKFSKWNKDTLNWGKGYT
jgi:ankyrin repeat protein